MAKAHIARGRRVLLIAGVPPCSNYSGGIFLEQIVRATETPAGVFVVQNRHLTPVLSDDLASRLSIRTCLKPDEQHLPAEAPAKIRRDERQAQLKVVPELYSQALRFATEVGATDIWIVLEGQTLIRLAHMLVTQSGLPIHVQVMDPPPSGSTTSEGTTSVGNRNRGHGYGAVRVRSGDVPAGASGKIVFDSQELFDRWMLAGGEAKGGTIDRATKSVRIGAGGGGLAADTPIDVTLERLPFEGDELSSLRFEFTNLGGSPPPTLLLEQIQEGASVGGVTIRPPAPNVLYLPVSVRTAVIAGPAAQQRSPQPDAPRSNR